ncbi:dUTPase-like protein [Tuber borchii]|uniref:Deoxyuridine 5'-triphosphate nucleotidohydrolase n=1 Tax=Tuber borchii TaxID=42251 RepID=A0A2T7A029_TUBBO|nr:dUTPase-like protein [Tuber borchii]
MSRIIGTTTGARLQLGRARIQRGEDTIRDPCRAQWGGTQELWTIREVMCGQVLGASQPVIVEDDGRMAPRSGLASKNFIDSGTGVIGADYHGQVKVLLFNHGEADFVVSEGDRIAQLIPERVPPPPIVGFRNQLTHNMTVIRMKEELAEAWSPLAFEAICHEIS